MAVGSDTTSAGVAGLAERWDGAKWSVQSTVSTGNQEELLGVSCPASNECTAVGDYEPGEHWVAMIQTWNGLTWSTQASNVDEAQASELHAVSCVAGSTCAAVGVTGWSAAGRSRSGFVEALGEIRFSGPLPTQSNPTAPALPQAAGPASALPVQPPHLALGEGAVARKQATAVRCKVPGLKNVSLRRAQLRLSRTHCALGRVTRPRRFSANLVIRQQSHSVGASLAANAKVNVVLGTRPRARTRRR